MRSVVRVYLGPSEQQGDSDSQLIRSLTYSGAVAQLGERRFCKPEVVGSIPISSIAPVDGAGLFSIISVLKRTEIMKRVAL